MEHYLGIINVFIAGPRREHKVRNDWFIVYGVSDLIVYLHSRIHIHPYTVNPYHMVTKEP